MQQTKRTRAKREEKKINHDDTGKKISHDDNSKKKMPLNQKKKEERARKNKKAARAEKIKRGTHNAKDFPIPAIECKANQRAIRNRGCKGKKKKYGGRRVKLSSWLIKSVETLEAKKPEPIETSKIKKSEIT